MDTPFPLLCKPQVGGIVIFNNFAALHFIFYTKEFTFATYFNEKLNIFLVNLDFLAKYVGFAVVFHLVKLPKRGLFLLFLAVFGLLHGAGAAFYHAAALEHISNAMQKDFCIVQELSLIHI